MWGLVSEAARLEQFAEWLKAQGHRATAASLRKQLARYPDEVARQGSAAYLKFWMADLHLDGEPLLLHWRRFLSRARQAEYRRRTKGVLVSVRIDKRLKTQLERLAEPSETLSDVIARLTAPARVRRSRRQG